MIEEIVSSEGFPIKSPETPTVPQDSPNLESEQASTETSPKGTPISRPVLKRKVVAQPSPTFETAKEPSSKWVKSAVAPSPKLEKFLKWGVVRGKIVKVGYFREQGLEVFLDKLKAQGWFELFTNTPMGCSQPDLAEFYVNVSVSESLLTSTVNG